LRDYFGYRGAGGIFSGYIGGGGGTSYRTWKETAAGESWGNGIYQDETVYGSADQLMGEPLEWSEYEAHYGQGLFQKVDGYYVPVGGEGGDGDFPGGFGCGGGGGSQRWVGSAGGGGGGYSGGWAGDASNDKDGNTAGGSGGGSFASETCAVAGSILMFQHGATNNPGNGFVKYLFPAPATSSVAYNRSFNKGTTVLHSGDYHLSWQGDGNLVLYGPPGPIWASNTSGASLSFQGDGNLVIRNASGQAVWASDTANAEKADGKGGRKLILTPLGKLAITNQDHKVIWAKN
jgi:hypothetical protein